MLSSTGVASVATPVFLRLEKAKNRSLRQRLPVDGQVQPKTAIFLNLEI
ncbi:hypothetical protein [Pseudomonas retamae]|uniref:Uncharacterized protein n=1 Tax=Pseudomonas retamae TaxID=702110 RepID=A0ABW7DAE3_9PSED